MPAPFPLIVSVVDPDAAFAATLTVKVDASLFVGFGLKLQMIGAAQLALSETGELKPPVGMTVTCATAAAAPAATVIGEGTERLKFPPPPPPQELNLKAPI
jgi:hypothetical protein